jgi:hypothetical protein
MSKLCAQIVPKICRKYQNVSNNIEIHRNLGAPKNRLIVWEYHYFLCLSFFRCFLHTVEVTGSNPVSPTTLLSTTSTIDGDTERNVIRVLHRDLFNRRFVDDVVPRHVDPCPVPADDSLILKNPFGIFREPLARNGGDDFRIVYCPMPFYRPVRRPAD